MKPGKGSPRYGTGRTTTVSGYVRVWVPGHPVAKADGYALEHRYVVHEAGLTVPPGFHVHHRNGDKQDNQIENLEVVTSVEHGLRHRTSRTQRTCEGCGVVFWPGSSPRLRFCSRVCFKARPAWEQACRFCSSPFMARSARALYCSALCRNRACRLNTKAAA